MLCNSLWSVFNRNPTFSCRGTFYNGKWDLQDSGKLHLVFRGYNNLKVQSRSEIEPDVEVVMHDGESCMLFQFVEILPLRFQNWSEVRG